MLTAKGNQPQRRAETACIGGPVPWPVPPEILILDDSSSALDYRTDAALAESPAGRVSGHHHCHHRPACQFHPPRQPHPGVEEGKELGYGDHEHLLKTCQVYQEIAQSQMGVQSLG